MARRTRKTRRKRYSPSPRRSRTKTKTKTPTPPKPAGRRARRRRRTRRRGGVGNQGQIAAVRKSLKHVKTKVGKRAPQLPRGDGFHGTNGVEMEMDDWLKYNNPRGLEEKYKPVGGRRRRNRRRRTRRQRGGCTNCPLNMQANLYASLDPVLPPGGGYQPGGRNGLEGGYYYNLNCPNGTCHPASTTGNMWPGYDRQIEKWAQKKFAGGRRRRRRRKSRRRRRKRRRNSRRRNQRGGAPSTAGGDAGGGGNASSGDKGGGNDDADEGTPVGPGVGASIKTPPIRQAMGRLVTGIRNITPGPIVGVARSAASKLGNLQHAYYGEEAASTPDVMDQPRMQANLPSDALDSLSAAKPQPGGSEGMDEDGPIGEEAAKEAAQEAAHDPAK